MIRSAKATRLITVEPSDENDIRTTLTAALERVNADLEKATDNDAKASLRTQKSTLSVLIIAFSD